MWSASTPAAALAVADSSCEWKWLTPRRCSLEISYWISSVTWNNNGGWGIVNMRLVIRLDACETMWIKRLLLLWMLVVKCQGGNSEQTQMVQETYMKMQPQHTQTPQLCDDPCILIHVCVSSLEWVVTGVYIYEFPPGNWHDTLTHACMYTYMYTVLCWLISFLEEAYAILLTPLTGCTFYYEKLDERTITWKITRKTLVTYYTMRGSTDPTGPTEP